MAYWAAGTYSYILGCSEPDSLTGFPLTLQYYFGRILILLGRIAVLSKDALQVNRPIVDYYFCSWSVGYTLDKILAGVHLAVKDVNFDDPLFERFKDYVDSEESRMQKTLEDIKYCIDAQNTLSELITGSSRRLEKVGL